MKQLLYLLTALLLGGEAHAQLTLTTALDDPALVWTTGGSAQWSAQNAFTHDGVDAARSGLISHDQESWLETTVTGPGRLTFWWFVSSEGNFDWLRFFTDGEQRVQISGESGWQERSYDLAAGVHQLRWQYVKDLFDTLGQDRGWLDQVSFVPASGPPAIVTHPTQVTAWAGANIKLSAVAFGESPLAHQWYFNETQAIAGATSPTLLLNAVTPAEVGAYQLVASSGGNSVTSHVARVTLTNQPALSMALLYVEGTISSAFEVALLNLDISYSWYTDEFSFSQAVNLANRANTLVIVDATENQNAFAAVISHVNAGGRAILSAFSLGGQVDLAAAFHVAIARRIMTPLPLHDWGGSPLFAGLSSPLALAELGFNEDGQKLHVLEGACGVGGFSANPASGEAGLVIGHSGRTILNSFFPQNATLGSAAVRLAENEILFLTGPVSSTAPLIKAEPESKNVVPGGQTTLQVVAWGGAPLTYQWYKDGAPIDGATASAYSVVNAQANQSGEYHVVVSNAYDAVMSQPASLTVQPNSGVTRVLTYLEDPFSTAYVAALDQLSQSHQFTQVHFSDETHLNAALREADPLQTLVIVESPLATHQFTYLPEFVQAGGRAIFQYWNLRPGSALAAAFQASVLGSFNIPMSVYDWEPGGPFFAGLSSSLFMSDQYVVDGQRLQPTAGGRAVAGFVTVPVINQAALVLGNFDRTLLSGFFPREISSGGQQFALNELEFFFDNAQPSIIDEPQDQYVVAGGNATFTVRASGSAPLLYQWQKDEIDVPGATLSSHTVTGVQAEHVGGYRVVINNTHGAVTSRVAQLGLSIPAFMVQPPISQSVAEGGSVTVSVEVGGSPPIFGIEWRRIGVTTALASNTVHGTKDFHTLSNLTVSDTGNYRVIVRQIGTVSAPNKTFRLTVLADTDHDGLPNQWENDYFQSTTGADPNADADGDGQLNRDEYSAGTNPTNSNELLQFDRIQLGPPLMLDFLSVTTKTYSVLYKNSLQEQGWSRLLDIVAEETNHTETIFDNADQPSRIYRLVTPRVISP